MNRQKAALIIMGVPLRQLLMAVHDVDRVVDVQHHGLGRLLIAPAPDVDERVSERMISRNVGAFSQREMVGCEQRSLPVSGRRPHASLKAESQRSRSKSLPSG